MTSRPRVSVVIPAYGAERFIAETIGSLRAQTLEDWELIVIDDASSDDTVTRARQAARGDPRISITVNPDNLGPAANWNRAIAAATAPYVKLLCSDDLLLPDCLAAQCAALDAHPTAGFVAARRDVINADGRVLFSGRGLQGLEEFMKGHRALHAMIRCATTPFGEPSVVLWRAAALSHAGPFREDYGTLIDVDMYARVLRDWDCVSLKETVAKFRVRAASWSDRSHRVQGRNMRRFINDCAADPANEIGPLLRAQGLGRSVLNQYGRRLAFALHK